MLHLANNHHANLEQIKQWDDEFNCFHEPMAVRISQSIAAITFQALLNSSLTLAHTLPNFNVMHMEYDFNLLRQACVPTLAYLAGNQSQMAPFKQWFQIFGDPKIYVRYPQSENAMGLSLPAGCKWQTVAANPDYFHGKMHKLLRRTFQQLVTIFGTAQHQFSILHKDQSIEYIFASQAKAMSQENCLDFDDLKNTYGYTFSKEQASGVVNALQTLTEYAQVDMQPKKIHLRIATNTHLNALVLKISIFKENVLARL